MNDYKEIIFKVTPYSEAATDVLAAMLADVGFESFVPDNRGVTAYIKAADWNEASIDDLLSSFPLFDVTIEIENAVTVEGRDWNSEWEKNYFKPIVVGDRCVIHSSFHVDYPKCQFDIVIDPKMAFGTGHHATTSLILEQLLSMDLTGKSVLDMGTGTGILAILAAMRGASPVRGIEIDEAAYVNALDNVALNNTPQVKLYLGDASSLPEATASDPVDVFIANINRNVITGDIKAYSETMAKNGTMFLSGFYEDDIPVVEAAARDAGLKSVSHTVKDRWTCLKLVSDR